jgi:hypothetical protein
MIEALKKEKETTFIISVVTFGENSQARLYLPYTKAQDVKWQPLNADGSTPLGDALIIAKNMIEDKNVTPSRSLNDTLSLFLLRIVYNLNEVQAGSCINGTTIGIKGVDNENRAIFADRLRNQQCKFRPYIAEERI